MALRDDNINLHINVTSSEAQESIRKLSESNRDLEKTNKAVRLEMEKLKAQGKEESDEFKQLETAYKSNSASIRENTKEIKGLEKSLGLNDMTMTQLRKHAKELQTQLDHTVESADPKGYADLQKQLEATKGRMGELKGAGQSLAGQLSSIPGPAGSVVQGVMGINSAFKILLANPIMAVIAAVVAVFMALYNAMKSSEEATNKLNAIMAPLGAIMDAILNVVQKCVGAILDFITAIINGLMKALENLPFVGKYFKELNEYSREAIELEKSKQALAKRERVATEENAKIERDVSELRNKAKQKDLYTEQERIKFLEEAISLERKRADENRAIAAERLRIAQIEADRADNDAATNNKLAQMKAEFYKADQEYHDRTRRLTSELSTFKIAQEKERTEAAKKALEAQLKAVDSEIAGEKAKYMQARLDREITQKEFNEKMEALELESLSHKLEIHGLEKEKRDEINQAILEAKMKFLEEEEKQTKELTEKLRVDALTKNEKELDDIRKKYEVRQKLHKDALDKKLSSETEYQAALISIQEEMQKELDKKKQEQEAAKATETMAKLDKEQEEERVRLMEKYANTEITQEEYQQGLLDLEQQFLEERLRINGLTEEQITKLKSQQLQKQISEQDKALKKQEDRQKKYTQLFLNFVGNMGEALGEALTNSENSFADSVGNVLLTALDGLRQMMVLYITETTMRNISGFGFIGIAKAAAEIALINAAYAAVKGIIKRPDKKNVTNDPDPSNSGRMEVRQHARGKYDVIGNEDRRLYEDVPFIGSPESGIIKKPALIAEQGDELIISSPDLQMLKKHVNYPYIVSAINEVRAGTVPQHSAGNYTSIEFPENQEDRPGGYQELLEKIALFLEKLNNEGVKTIFGFDEYDAKRKLLEDSRKIGTLE